MLLEINPSTPRMQKMDTSLKDPNDEGAMHVQG